MSSTTQVFILVIFFILLIVQAVTYLYRSGAFSLYKNRNAAQEKIRYDSKVSRCSLIFDRLNSILLVAYDKKEIPVDFADIIGYEVIANRQCLIKVNRSGLTVFDIETENKLRSQLNDLEKEDFPKGSIRQIELKFFHKVESKNKVVSINFYYRKGNQRLSRHSFADSVDNIVSWCTLLESAILPYSVVDEGANTVIEVEPREPLNTSSQPAVPEETPDAGVTSSTELTQTKQKNDNLVDELLSLVTLKEKGFLSEVEFQKAKYKILD